jgi:hypothetical protein
MVINNPMAKRDVRKKKISLNPLLVVPMIPKAAPGFLM